MCVITRVSSAGVKRNRDIERCSDMASDMGGRPQRADLRTLRVQRTGGAYPRSVTSVRDLLATLTRIDPAHPRLTWYGPGGERVDLSGRVLGNWVTKACNLLVEEADAGPGTRVVLDLPVHWRAVVWALASWTCGAQVVVLPPPGLDRPLPHDLAGAVVVTDRPGELAARTGGGAGAPDLVVAVALPALALRFPGSLPPGTLDGAADLMTYPDALGWLPPLDPSTVAIVGGPSHRDLVAWARTVARANTWPSARRVLTGADDPEGHLAVTLAAFAAMQSVVIVTDTERDLDALADVERAHVVPGGNHGS